MEFGNINMDLIGLFSLYIEVILTDLETFHPGNSNRASLARRFWAELCFGLSFLKEPSNSHR